MDTFTRFLYEFLSQFFLGIKTIFVGLIQGVKTIFSVNTYVKIIQNYKQDFSGPEWVLVAVGIFMLVLIVAIIAAILIILIKKYIKFRRRVADEEDLLMQVNKLSNEVTDLIKEKEELVKRTNAIEEAKERYNSKSFLWRLVNKKTNPLNMDYDSMKTEEIESLYRR